jgi:Cof subfamily protein (haloacid dehalogenase superfamily)
VEFVSKCIRSEIKDNQLFMNTLYISDLDGTLLQPNARLSDFARETLNRMLDEGLQFSIATGRSVVSMQDVLAGLNLRLPIIELDGAYLTDLASGQHHVIRALAPETAVAVLEETLGCGLQPFVKTFDGRQDRLYYGQGLNGGMDWFLQERQRYKDRRLQFEPNLQSVLHEQVIGFTVIGQAEALMALRQTLVEGFGSQLESYLYENQYAPGWYWMTVHDAAATKAQGIAELQAMMDLQHLPVVAFGDQHNDLPMLQAADWGVGMANGITAVHQIADEVIGPNVEDSVVRYIQAAWNKRSDK